MLGEAAETADAAAQDWGDGAAVAAPLRLAGGRLSYLRGELRRAQALLERGLQLAEIAASPSVLVIGLAFQADVRQGLGDRPAAQQSLVRAREVADLEPMSPLAGTVLEESEARIGRAAVRAAVGSRTLIEELTDRELAILRLLPGTASQREIGAALFISINTVKAYNRSLYRKLNAGSRAEAVLTARRLGLI